MIAVLEQRSIVARPQVRPLADPVGRQFKGVGAVIGGIHQRRGLLAGAVAECVGRHRDTDQLGARLIEVVEGELEIPLPVEPVTGVEAGVLALGIHVNSVESGNLARRQTLCSRSDGTVVSGIDNAKRGRQRQAVAAQRTLERRLIGVRDVVTQLVVADAQIPATLTGDCAADLPRGGAQIRSPDLPSRRTHAALKRLIGIAAAQIDVADERCA